MRLSTVIELLIIALLVAFAASRVIDGPNNPTSKLLGKDHRFAARRNRQNQDPPSRYCSCSSLTCNCCREFSLPVVPVKGPGCATVSYLHDDAMMITMSFGDRVLRNITVNSKKPKPICMGMPGGISKFCGRLYSIKKDGDNFKACLGLELRALDDVEAALRVSCFKFGPNGVNVEPGEAVPAEKNKEDEEDDDDDYGLGDLDDDDDDDDDFGLSGVGDDDDDDDDEEDEKPPGKVTYNDVDSSDSDVDYTGFSALSEELFGGFFGSSGSKKRPNNDDDDDDDDKVYAPEPVKLQSQNQAPPQKPVPQVNLVVMHPVIIPAPAVVTPKPAGQRRPVKKPQKVSSTPAPVKRVQPTTVAPIKKVKTTPGPVKTLQTTISLPEPSVNNATTKPPSKKKKKKPLRRRKPATSKPTSPTEIPSTVITATAMTVNVVQDGVNLNDSSNLTHPVEDVPLKIPMSKPVIETKPLEQSDSTLVTSIDKNVTQNMAENLNVDKEKAETETNGPTTILTILQNTIPTDESIGDNLYSTNLQKIPQKDKLDQQNDEVLVEDLMTVSTMPTTGNTDNDEYMTKLDTTTVKDDTSFTNSELGTDFNPEKFTTIVEHDTTRIYSELDDEGTTTQGIEKDELKNGEVLSMQHTNLMPTKSVEMTTSLYDRMDEATDKTETITENPIKEISSDDDETEEDEDEDGIDIGADLGLEDDDDDDDEDEEVSEKVTILKPEEKDDDEDDILGGLLDDDEEDDSNSKDANERSFRGNVPYKINPLLYRIARVSSGSIATARHLPRFDEGRKRRNNKRMRFTSLDLPE